MKTKPMPNGRYQHRKAVYDKLQGHCAYCGREIALIDMQIDHIVPRCIGGTNDLENLNPSCRRCNHYKRDYDLQGFRKLILTLHERIQKQYIEKVAIDYGIVTVTPWDGIFYFEQVKLNQ